MSRSGRRDLVTIVAVAVTLAAALLMVAAARATARPPAPSCGWDGLTLSAANLPDEWSVTSSASPIGVFERPSTFSATFAAPFTAYFWTRGGPYEALFKPGKQLNDYKPVCVAAP